MRHSNALDIASVLGSIGGLAPHERVGRVSGAYSRTLILQLRVLAERFPETAVMMNQLASAIEQRSSR